MLSSIHLFFVDSLWQHFQCWHQWHSNLFGCNGNSFANSLLSNLIRNTDSYWGKYIFQWFFFKLNWFGGIIYQAIGGYTYHADQSWKADSSSGSLDGPIKSIAASDNSGADLGVFMCKDSEFYGVVGLAWVGTMCKGWAGYNAGVNEKRQNVLATSEVNQYQIKVEFCHV